ncbi:MULTISPECIES: TetR/AcrR family transcriptional regulator [Methylobacterium]|uniref:TetR/AcrR family transcriptional regulator n=1 Tax=unclassified Methylobacterium TaxID=2615210 RepID=UPI001F3B93E9|nr:MULTISPECIES: TetR/AcrR family transcriptional regulator [Methylobacterium]UIN32476.1 TetR/AcrR family transcriptional regulator [Methylobacterium oryzae]
MSKEDRGVTVTEIERVEAGPRRGGRPTRAEAARREAHLIAVATTLFLERGFDATSIDAVAEAAGMSKPTVYARYRDKRALFEAVLRERIAAWLAPLSAAAEAQAAQGGSDDVETALEDLSRTLLAHGQSPGAAMLKRNLVAQALQFPELARLAHEEGWLRGVRAVAQLLDAFARRGRIAVADPEIAADLFLSLVLGRSSQATLYGIATDPEAQERRRQAAVRLFLDGVRPR